MVGVWGADVGFGGGAGVEELGVVLVFGVFGGELRGLAFCVSRVGIVIHLEVLP